MAELANSTWFLINAHPKCNDIINFPCRIIEVPDNRGSTVAEIRVYKQETRGRKAYYKFLTEFLEMLHSPSFSLSQFGYRVDTWEFEI